MLTYTDPRIKDEIYTSLTPKKFNERLGRGGNQGKVY